MARKVKYADGYDHYSHRRNVQVTFLLNEAERAALDDLMAVVGARSISSFVRSQLFRAYRGLSREQKRQLREVREWRAKERRCKD